MIKKWFPLLTMIILGLGGTLSSLSAQADKPEMADVMRSNGKIYVVVAVVTVIFIGIILYLIRLDRKISRLEKRESPNS